MKFEDLWVDVDGIKTRYWTAGDQGPPVILMHGISSSIEAWQSNIAELSATHRVFAIDLLGCGLTDKPTTQSYQPTEMRDHVLGFMDAMGIESTDLIGWSMGGRIALHLAHTAPERVRRIVLTAPAGIGPNTIINFRLATVPFLGELLTKPNKAGTRMLYKAALYDDTMISDEFLDPKVAMAKLPGAHAAFLKQLRSFVGFGGFRAEPRAELLSWLPGITAPTLAIWGAQDKFVSAAHGDILTAEMPNARVAKIESSGHLPQLEQSVMYNSLVTEFLA